MEIILSLVAVIEGYWRQPLTERDSTEQNAIDHHPLKMINRQSNSLLLSQPLDVLLEIASHLPPETAAALSLTCEVARAVFLPRNPSDADLRAIRHSFEKDVSDGCFYCFNCGKYHRYSKSWRFETNLSYAAVPPYEKRINLDRIGVWDFGFHNFQLVMN